MKNTDKIMNLLGRLKEKEDKARKEGVKVIRAIREVKDSRTSMIDQVRAEQNERQKGNPIYVRMLPSSKQALGKYKTEQWEIRAWRREGKSSCNQLSCTLEVRQNLDEALREYIAWVDYFVGVYEKQRTEVLV